ncbi:Ubiquitin carboxyl-terminal hydrolase CYLD [Orchesella cincta]|uniref:ubiquitinyl hydrolase 1 n=1 Tax=Orchesella cincta TaxID=48709 RepID=A0A1D2NH56_ORCCI|nr:Ubiquitin carboxyl-terminal hydrolase CYLD [Orchesella cincta]
MSFKFIVPLDSYYESLFVFVQNSTTMIFAWSLVGMCVCFVGVKVFLLWRSSNKTIIIQNEKHDGVKKGDRVVWVREPPETNESGVIRWTGVIEGEEIAGIEFDRPLGLGSGWYKNKQLFTCTAQRGGLVAVAGLILEDDYFYNPEISTKDVEEDTGGQVSPIRGDSSLSASSGIGSGSGIHSSPSPSPSSSSSTSLDVGSYDTSSTSSTGSRKKRYNHSADETSCSTITVSKNTVSDRPKLYSAERIGQGDIGAGVTTADGPVVAGPRVSQWTSKASGVLAASTSSYKCPPKTSETIQTDNNLKQAVVSNGNNNDDSNMPIPFVQAPLREEDGERISGRSKGIQGHRNSCYLDATLFSMFSFSGVFDSILLQEWNGQKDAGDEELARNVQRILRDDVVNPLRKELYCTARNVMKLRETMQHLDDKLTSEEMDPQEFLQLLFSKVLNLEEFMSLSSGHSDFFHQVLVAQTEEDKNKIPTIQQLFEQSLIMQELKLKTVPRPALILQMPRSGNKYKMYDGILPNLSIDITDLMEDIPRMCIICGSLATHECPSCYGKFSSGGEARDTAVSPGGSGAESTAFCETCLHQIHKRRDRQTHLSHIVPIKYSFDASQYFSFATPISPTSTTGHHQHHLNHHLNNANSGNIPSYLFGASGSWATSGGGGTGGFVGGNPNFNRNPSTAPLISSIPSPSYAVSSSRTIPRVTMDLFAVICIETSHFVSFVKCGTERQAPWVFFDSMADRVENPNGTGHNIPQVKLLPRMGCWLEELEKSPRNIKEFMSPDSNMAPELRRLLSDPYICLYYSPQSCMYS